MSALLKKLERKVGQSQQEQESSGMTAMMDDIRTGIDSLRTIAEQDSSRDERTSTLEKLVIRLYDALEKSEQERKAEDALETVEDKAECDRLKAELEASELECENLETELDVAKEALLVETRRGGEIGAALARAEAMHEAEKRARIVAEQALSDANIRHEKHMVMMCGKEEKADVEMAGWDVMPVRDTANNVLRYELTPKKN